MRGVSLVFKPSGGKFAETNIGYSYLGHPTGGLRCLNSQSAGNCLKRILNPTFKNRKKIPYYRTFTTASDTGESTCPLPWLTLEL